ncbi:lysophospholipid acyltransferase family protein [Mucilaginibacter sp. AW1-3]
MLRKLHARIYRYSVAVFIFLFYPLLYLFSRKPSRYPAMNKVRKICGFLSSTLAGVFYSIDYESTIDWSKTYIVCPNHVSNLDVTGTTLGMHNNFHYIGKEALLDKFPLNLFFKTIDIPVNRDSKMSSFRAFKRAEQNLKSGMSLIIFPEGKIPDDYPPQLNPFKNGPFRLAIELKIPIIPVTCIDTWKVLWDTGLEIGSNPGLCHIYFHKPIDTSKLTVDDADALKDQVFNIIDQKFKTANKFQS